jgi:CheY-like chemotaxis protein
MAVRTATLAHRGRFPQAAPTRKPLKWSTLLQRPISGIRVAQIQGAMTSINGKSILVIEDDAAMLRALGKVLTNEGASVASATWVGDVMERLDETKGRIDLIITDLRMPVMNGQSILRAGKAALPAVPVIVITAFVSPQIQADCRAEGAAAFLEKPLDTPQSLAAIDRVLSAPKSGRGLSERRWRHLRKPRASNQTLTPERTLA